MLNSGADAIGHAEDWEDKTVQLHNVSLHFSWKPEMFSLDDISMLQSKSRLIRPAAVFVRKGLHDAVDWLEKFQSQHVPQRVFLTELKERALRLQSMLSDLFPDAKLFWRQAYHNHLDDARENASQLIADIVDPIFGESRFYMVPGQEVSTTCLSRWCTSTSSPKKSGAPYDGLCCLSLRNTNHLKSDLKSATIILLQACGALDYWV